MRETFRIIKGILNMEDQEREKKTYLYVLYGDRGIYAMDFRFLEGRDAPVGLTTEWAEFASYVASSWKEPEAEYVALIKDNCRDFFEKSRLKDLFEGSRDGERGLEQRLNALLEKTLGLPIFSFLKVQKCDATTVRDFLKQFGDPSVLEEPEEDADSSEEEPEMGMPLEYLPCGPVIDPVHGKSVGSLSEGERILVKLPPETKLYKVLSRAREGHFDGAVPGTLLRMEEKGPDRYLLEIGITDRIRGLLILQKSLRLRPEEYPVEEIPARAVETLLSGRYTPYLVGGAVFLGVGFLLFWLYRFLFMDF
ncbi:MAG TPA: hypothetical protein PK364_04505 [Synergistaceae bacterium]|nr:hypothetical protein [Synergistaceae bacterium]HPJ25386.1 hypothetical protein [Synergistaceae bacterium]HPQ37169.1 hypothetical protein [Synergistaceae bacterium]